MKLKTFFFNKGIQKQNVKQHGWIGIVYLVGLLFALPLQMLLMTSNEEVMHEPVDNLFQIGFASQLFFILFLPVLAGIVIFRYIQTKSSSDIIHSLPIRRKDLYLNHIFTGLMLLLPPVWLSALSAAVITNTHSFFESISSGDIWGWVFAISIMTMFLYVFSVMVGMVTGMSTAQGVLTFILLVLPPALFFLITASLSRYLHGFPASYYSSENITSWSPVMKLTELDYNNMSLPITELIIYFLLTIVFGVAAYFLYKIRPLETAGQAIAFQPLKPIFKYGVTFCSMLVGAVYFQRFNTYGWIGFGYIAGALIGFFVAEMIIQKTWRIWSGKLLKGFAIYAGIIVIVGIGINTDVMGYEKAIPSKNEIEGVYFGENLQQLMNEDENKEIYANDQRYIQNVRAFHDEMIDKKQQTKPRQSRRYIVSYKLDNGEQLVREYSVSNNEKIDSLAAVMESETYKRSRFQLSELDKPMESIVIAPHVPTRDNVTISNPKEIEEIRQLLKYEISRLTIDDMLENGKNWGHIILNTEENIENAKSQPYAYRQERPVMMWKKTFDEFESWLQAHGYLEKARVTPKDIQSLEVVNVPDAAHQQYFPDQVFMRSTDNNPIIEVKDSQAVENILNNYSEHGDGTYFCRFITDSREEFYGVLTEDEVPEEIVTQFK
ncbi:ABC-2 family transporter permease [Alteribacillus iranensis]|uniref:ABC-2 type transport system permease protein n=1 Tax=Alteribacillus iranensis TaxID=930128 RepID=A0A1I2E2I9_9BACI|nr:ABC transporter permease [Alteribacillus iranensis]SFE86420.1 ABC-2 type transport system permease protein [Alteribacillus iranensis]